MVNPKGNGHIVSDPRRHEIYGKKHEKDARRVYNERGTVGGVRAEARPQHTVARTLPTRSL